VIRLTGGLLRGRKLKLPALDRGLQLRPSHARFREALFQTLQFHLEGAEVLDLFAGAGTLGIESLSRGAQRAVFVEKDPRAFRAIQNNLNDLELKEGRVIRGAFPSVASRLVREGPFDLVFADPPYGRQWERKLLEELDWTQLLRVGGIFSLDWGGPPQGESGLPDQVSGLEKCREKAYGDSWLTQYERRDS